MAGYTGSEAYDFSLFEPQVIEKPKTTQKKQAPEPKKDNSVKIRGMNQTVKRQSQHATVNPAVVNALLFCLIGCVCLVATLMLEARSNELSKQISSIENQISIAHGESVSLNAQLSSRVSTDKIETYAEEVLGMVKAESYQISYIDLSEGDKVVVSGDKTVESKNSTEQKIKELFAYIF